MTAKELFGKFHETATNPQAAKERYIAEGKKVVLMGSGIHTGRDYPFYGNGADGSLGR